MAKYTRYYGLIKPGLSDLVSIEDFNKNFDTIDTVVGKRQVRMPAVYCWGDSLTWGAGGNIDGWHAVDYPGEVAKIAICHNLGVPGEDTITIMARQGADPMIAKANIVIPADRTPVLLADTGLGIPTKSGKHAFPCRQASTGVNPVLIGDVLGDIIREATDAGTGTAKYYFRRRIPGTEVKLGDDTVIQTLAMRYPKGGVACIWMGANGGWDGNVSVLVNQIDAMLAYGEYDNYLILVCRELTDEQAGSLRLIYGDRFLNIKEYLNERGLMDAGIITSDNTLMNGIPVQLDSGDGLHLNYYGYKAVGGFVAENLIQLGMLQNAKVFIPETNNENESRPMEDEYGTMLYRLQSTFVGDGIAVSKDTGLKLFSEDIAQWTLAISFKAEFSCDYGYPATIATCINNAQLATRYEGFCIRRSSDTAWYDINLGGASINTNSENIIDATTPFTGYETVIVRRDGDRYSVIRNGVLAYQTYGGWLTYAMTGGSFDSTLILGASVNQEGNQFNFTKCIIRDLRVYDSALNTEEAIDLCEEMAAELAY